MMMICNCTLAPKACSTCPVFLGQYDIELTEPIWEDTDISVDTGDENIYIIYYYSESYEDLSER